MRLKTVGSEASRQWPVGSWQSAVGSRRSAVGSRRSAVGSEDWGESAVGSEDVFDISICRLMALIDCLLAYRRLLSSADCRLFSIDIFANTRIFTLLTRLFS